MKNLFLIFIVCLLLQLTSPAQPGSFEFEGRTRNYEVYLPQGIHANMPVVITLHYYTGSIQKIKDLTKMHEAADTTGFITVYPQSASISWNTGETKPPWGAMYDTTVNDVGFISALIDTVDSYYDIDLNRIYVCGHSSGGEMTFRLITELGHRFAAAASVAGPLNDISASTNPIRPFPIIQMHGTADPSISYYAPYYNLWSIEETLNFWIDNNGCTFQADTILLPDIDTSDNCTVNKISYTDCTGDNIVVHYQIINGGHPWPGTDLTFTTGGNINQDINASIEILNFFKNYENPLVNIVWARAVEVSPKYINPQGDTLFVVAHTANPEIHSAFVYAKIKGEEVSFSDSLQLYDDGLHFDENPSDNIWGNAKVLSGLEEDFYKVDIYTHDLSMGTIHKYHWFDSFTTAGPVTLDSISISESFGSSYEIYLYVLNEGGARTITDAHIKLICNDPWYKIREPDQGSLPNISPGEVVSSPRLYVGYIDSLFPGYFNFKVEIMSEGRTTYWIDSMQVIVPGVEVEGEELQPLSYKLEQNYPNPFNPITTIKYQIPELSFVVLKVYDVLGNEISTLVEDEKSVGSNEVEFNAANLPSGIYFYKLQAGDFMEVKKMVLLR